MKTDSFQPDRHASERERKRDRARRGMRVRGRSTRMLAALQTRSAAPRARRRIHQRGQS